MSADIGRKLCRRCERAIVLVNSNLFSRKIDSRSWSSTDAKFKLTVGIAAQPNSNSWRGVKIWSSYGRSKLALAASLSHRLHHMDPYHVLWPKSAIQPVFLNLAHDNTSSQSFFSFCTAT